MGEIPPALKTVFIRQELNAANDKIEIRICIVQLIGKPFPLRFAKKRTLAIRVGFIAFFSFRIRKEIEGSMGRVPKDWGPVRAEAFVSWRRHSRRTLP